MRSMFVRIPKGKESVRLFVSVLTVCGGMGIMVIASSTHHFVEPPWGAEGREVLLRVMVIFDASSRATSVGVVMVNLELNEKRRVT